MKKIIDIFKSVNLIQKSVKDEMINNKKDFDKEWNKWGTTKTTSTKKIP